MSARRSLKVGDVFGRLVVLGSEERAPPDNRGYRAYRVRVRCQCGVEFSVRESSLKGGNTTSCGCARREALRKSPGNYRHGQAIAGRYSGAYGSWRGLRSRCEDTNNPAYPRYGGRGIQVCDRWKRFESFFEDMGPRPQGTSIDRIDVNGNYEPDNCRWADNFTQAQNTRTTIRVDLFGEHMALAKAARALGITPSSLYEWRTRYDLSPQEALDFYVRRRAERQVGIVHEKKVRVDAKWVQLRGEKMILIAAVRRLGIDRAAVHKWMKRHTATHQEAIDHYAAKQEVGATLP